MADLTGKTLGKYRLVERLGRGGMAEVYKAYQPGLDRYVAIKLMHAYLAEDEDFIKRFKREGRAIGQLHHPHIVQVYDSDIEDDVYYMVQEYVEGDTLKIRLREASEREEILPIEETVRVLKAICGAIDYAHARGRIHRDVKPDNIMFDASDRPVLTDFGIASILGGEGKGTRLTATGAIVGTPAYMSPEQGKGEPGDARSDIYSLGVVLYEMVTGSVPFDADTPFAVVLKHVNEPLPLPRTLNPDVPFGVERAILKALAKDPEDRYRTAGELAEALEEAISEPETLEWGEPFALEAAPDAAEAPPVDELPGIPGPEPTESASQAVPVELAPARARKRKPWLWALIGGVALLAILVVVGVMVPDQEAVEEGYPTRIGAATASGPQTTRAATQSADSELAALIEAGNHALGDECDDVEEALAFFERAIERDPAFAAAYVGRARCWSCAGEQEAARADLEEAIELDANYAPAYFWRGTFWAEDERGEEAFADLTRAIELDPAYVDAYFVRSGVADWPLEDSDQAFVDVSKVIELAPDFAPAYLRRGRFHMWNRDDPEAALADFARFVELAPEDPEGYAERGYVYMDFLAEYDQAVVEYTSAIERAPDEAYLYAERAWSYHQWGKLDLAIEDYGRALEIDPEVRTYFYRGIAHYEAEHYDAALADLDKVLLLGWDESEGAAYHAKGWVFFALGRYEEAIDAYNDAEDYDWDSYSWLSFFDESDLRVDRAIAYRANGQFDEALGDLKELVDENEYWFRGYYERGLTYREMGEGENALEDLRRAWEYVEDDEWRARIEEEIESLPATE